MGRSNILFKAFALAVLIAVMGSVSGCGQSGAPQEEAARAHILEDDSYSRYNGTDLTHISSEEGPCEGCYLMTFRFSSDRVGIEGGDVQVKLREGEVVDMNYSVRTSVTSFSECETAGFEVLYPDCAGCADVCVTPDGKRFERVMGCVDRCGDGQCQEVVCQADGCPCAETPESCPEDCGKESGTGDTGQLCVDMCGDGRCQEMVCMGEDCPCRESRRTCPEDCP